MTEADLRLSSAGTPYAKRMNDLLKAKNVAEQKGKSTSNIESEIDAIKTLVEDYLKEHPQDNKNLIVKEITYGKDKNALLLQSFQLSGNKANKGNDNQSEETAGNDSDNSSDSSDNNTDVEVSYNLEFRTLNPKGNWHAKATVNTGSDNSDIHLAALYTNRYKNGGIVNFSGDFRQTIEEKNNVNSFAAAIDYRRNKFSTGAYYMCHSKEVEGEKNKSTYAEAYAKYGKSIRMAGGLESDNESKYYYIQGRLNGKKEFPDSNLTFTGGINAEYGIIKSDLASKPPKILEIKAKGSLVFKSKDFSADLSTNINMKKMKCIIDDGNFTDKTLTASLIGNVYTKNFDLTAVISRFNLNYSGNFDEYGKFKEKDSSTNTNITLGIKNVFGQNVIPTLSYNTGKNSDSNISVGVKLAGL